MIIKNAKIVLGDKIINKGYLKVSKEHIVEIGKEYKGNDKTVLDAKGMIVMPGFIDVHMHGSAGIDFMDAKAKDYKVIAESLYNEGVTTFLATTLTSDYKSLANVCREVKEAKEKNPSLLGIHFEGPYINAKYKGAQNEKFIRNPDIEEFDKLQRISGGNVKYISMAPEKPGSLAFIEHVAKTGVVVSAGHTDASFADVEKAIKKGLTNTTHTHNAMSPHHHRNPGVVTAAMYFDELYTECICDRIHVCDNTLRAFMKVVTPERFVMITDALKIKNSKINKFQLFGLDCVRKDGAAYLTSGPLAGSLLTMDQGIRNIKQVCKLGLVDLAKISSRNAARSLHLEDRGEIKVGALADLVLLDEKLNVKQVYKLGKRVK